MVEFTFGEIYQRILDAVEFTVGQLNENLLFTQPTDG